MIQQVLEVMRVVAVVTAVVCGAVMDASGCDVTDIDGYDIALSSQLEVDLTDKLSIVDLDLDDIDLPSWDGSHLSAGLGRDTNLSVLDASLLVDASDHLGQIKLRTPDGLLS